MLPIFESASQLRVEFCICILYVSPSPHWMQGMSTYRETSPKANLHSESDSVEDIQTFMSWLVDNLMNLVEISVHWVFLPPEVMRDFVHSVYLVFVANQLMCMMRLLYANFQKPYPSLRSGLEVESSMAISLRGKLHRLSSAHEVGWSPAASCKRRRYRIHHIPHGTQIEWPLPRFSKKSNTFCFKTTVFSFIFALFPPSTRSTRRPNLSQKHPQRPRHVTRLVGWRYWWIFQIWSFLAAQQKPVEISQQKPLKIGQKLKETSLSKLVSTHRTGTHP